MENKNYDHDLDWYKHEYYAECDSEYDDDEFDEFKKRCEKKWKWWLMYEN